MGSVVWTGRRRAHKSGVFKVWTEHPKFIERGHTGRFQAMFEHVKDGLIDPAGITLKLYEGSTLRVTQSSPTRDSEGVYYSDENISAAYGTGPWVAEWSGTYDGMAILVRAGFNAKRTVEE